MAWLDAPCKRDEISEWGCSDAFVDHPEWPWRCSNDDATKPQCGTSFKLGGLKIGPPPPPPPPPLTSTSVNDRLVGVVFGLVLVLVGGVCAAFAISKLGRTLFEFQSIATCSAPEKADDISEVAFCATRHPCAHPDTCVVPARASPPSPSHQPRPIPPGRR